MIKEEFFEEIISLLHCFAMGDYSSKKNLKKQIKDLSNK